MGNCCGTPAAAAANKNDVRHKMGARVANWRATGLISLREASLTELPPEVQEVPSVRVLDASFNRLTRLPPGLPAATLQRLVLSNNRLASLAGLELLANLKVLVLDANRIERLPDALGTSLPRLETLSLTDNQLARLPPSLGGLPRLRQLLLGCNQLRELPPELGDCAALEELDAHHNMLQELPPSLGRLSRLKLLQLDGNAIATIPPAILSSCTALSTISLHDNPITPEVLEGTEGYAEFEARRVDKYSKVLATGVLLGKSGMDEGLDRNVGRGGSSGGSSGGGDRQPLRRPPR